MFANSFLFIVNIFHILQNALQGISFKLECLFIVQDMFYILTLHVDHII